ncbi:MAG: phosphoenolpyruvate--protein phosphotransferase [Deltaproteobacteria bacterium]|nr:phosphoenolpyruvate--protein phosphotransferase [Deltaproteobacteria bacterium]
MEENRVLTGLGVSPGIAIGELFLLNRARQPGVTHAITADEVDREVELFQEAVRLSVEQLREAKDKIIDKRMHEHLFIIDAHLLILADQMFTGDTEALIRNDLISAESALHQTLEKFQAVFDSIDDEYLRDRKADLNSVGDRLLRNLRGENVPCVRGIEKKTILGAHELSPAITMQIDREKVVGLVSDLGGRSSHTAILARSFGIPAVFGLENFSSFSSNGVPVIVDGTDGVVVVNPSNKVFKEYLEKKQALEYAEHQLLESAGLAAETLDGQRISLCCNLEFPEETEHALELGAEGVGLYRTEILFLNRPDIPTEDEQAEALGAVVARMAPHPVTIRTLDVGGEKIVPEISPHEEANPAMGLRAVRFSLQEVGLFKTQLRAILRASQHGHARVMFPMISSLSEVRACKACLEEVKTELRREKILFDEKLPVGIMVETPSAAVLADILAREVDFFAVGTNDLIQYCLAVDRGNKNVAYLYDPLHPAVLRMLRLVSEAANKAGIGACVCGEMAPDPLYALILLGLGFVELSMNALFIPAVKRILRAVRYQDAEEFVNGLSDLATKEEITAYLKIEGDKRFPGLFEIP